MHQQDPQPNITLTIAVYTSLAMAMGTAAFYISLYQHVYDVKHRT